MIYQGRNQMIDIHRQGEEAVAVGKFEGYAHDAVNYISIWQLMTNDKTLFAQSGFMN